MRRFWLKLFKVLYKIFRYKDDVNFALCLFVLKKVENHCSIHGRPPSADLFPGKSKFSRGSKTYYLPKKYYFYSKRVENRTILAGQGGGQEPPLAVPCGLPLVPYYFNIFLPSLNQPSQNLLNYLSNFWYQCFFSVNCFRCQFHQHFTRAFFVQMCFSPVTIWQKSTFVRKTRA